MKKDKNKLPMNRIYQDVNENEVNLLKTSKIEAEKSGKRKTLNMLITQREDIKAVFGMECLLEINWT